MFLPFIEDWQSFWVALSYMSLYFWHNMFFNWWWVSYSSLHVFKLWDWTEMWCKSYLHEFGSIRWQSRYMHQPVFYKTWGMFYIYFVTNVFQFKSYLWMYILRSMTVCRDTLQLPAKVPIVLLCAVRPWSRGVCIPIHNSHSSSKVSWIASKVLKSQNSTTSVS